MSILKSLIIASLYRLGLCFVPAFKSRFSSSIRNSQLSMASATPLTDLCHISKEACDAVSPMLLAFYKKISAGESSATKLKSDATFFSIADGIVQHMFIEHLFKGNKFYDIVGEEDETKVNIVTKPYTVDDLVVPEEFDGLIESTLKKVQQLSTKIDQEAYKGITIFVDPIDGTREFATKQGDKVTVLIGYNNKEGRPVAGITYRPLTEPPTWAAGALSENCKLGNLDMAKEPKPRGILVTDGKVSPWLGKLIDVLGYEKIGSLASGNRALMILEGKAGAYIRDTGGFAKWDTSGPQAVFEAYGCTMSKLPAFIAEQKLESYTHLKATDNLDYQQGKTVLTLHNARDKSAFKKDEVTIVGNVNELKEYSCLCGLVALDTYNMQRLPEIQAAMKKAVETHDPLYT